MKLSDFAGMTGKTGGPIVGYARLNAHGAAPITRDPHRRCRSRSRNRQGHGAPLHRHPRRRPRHPSSYVEGQKQGGAVQGIGWALNEEYVYGADGQLQNAGFLDYRIPVASTCR